MDLKVPDISFHRMIIPEADRCLQVEGNAPSIRGSPQLTELDQATCCVEYVPAQYAGDDTDRSRDGSINLRVNEAGQSE